MDRKLNVYETSDRIAKNQLARWMINAVENYQLIKRALGEGKADTLLAVADTVRGRPAIITGSGPTLELSMPYMKDVVERHDPVIFCGLSNIGIYLQNGIRPHFMCVYDSRDTPHDNWFALDSHKKELKGIPLIVNPECDPSMLDFWINELGNPVYFFMRGTLDQSNDIYTHYLMGFLPQIYVVNPFIPRPLKFGIFNIGCVANIEMVAASQLGCGPLYLDGVNLGYPDGNLHANPVKKTDKGYEATGYSQETVYVMDGEDYFEADNGVLTDDINVLYKMALLTVWADTEADVFELTAEGKYGILDLPTKFPIERLAMGEQVTDLTIEEKKEKLKAYYRDHGYAASDFRAVNLEKVADQKVAEAREKYDGKINKKPG